MLSLPDDPEHYWSLVRRGARALTEGLIMLGASTAGFDPREALAALHPIAPAACPPGLPPAHPERPAGDVPPTAVERDLWARLS